MTWCCVTEHLVSDVSGQSSSLNFKGRRVDDLTVTRNVFTNPRPNCQSGAPLHFRRAQIREKWWRWEGGDDDNAVKMADLWYLTPCGPKNEFRFFGEICCLRLQCSKGVYLQDGGFWNAPIYATTRSHSSENRILILPEWDPKILITQKDKCLLPVVTLPQKSLSIRSAPKQRQFRKLTPLCDVETVVATCSESTVG